MEKIAISIGEGFDSPWGKDKGLADLVSVVLSNAIVIAGLIVFLLFLGGGIAVIAGAGQNNPETAAKGKQAVTAAAIGFIIIFASYWIIQIVEIVAGFNILNPLI